jgi:hypothetical protein
MDGSRQRNPTAETVRDVMTQPAIRFVCPQKIPTVPEFGAVFLLPLYPGSLIPARRNDPSKGAYDGLRPYCPR